MFTVLLPIPKRSSDQPNPMLPVLPPQPTDRQCRECGSEFKARNPSASFCASACRKAFNNRRLLRGAALYDSVMSHRQDQAAELVQGWQRQDAAARQGRPTWGQMEQAA